MNFPGLRFAVFFVTLAAGWLAAGFLDFTPPKINELESARSLTAFPQEEKTTAALSPVVETDPHLIVPGQSAGHLKLGDNRYRAIELFGRVDTEYDYDFPTELNCSARKELRFMELKDRSSPFHFDYGNGAWVYLRDDKIDQIKIQSEKFKTAEGLTVGSKPQLVKKSYPNVRTFVELNTQCDCTGGRNLIFWIDEQKGIAFEFHYWRNVGTRRLSYIFVFEPGTKFLPEGCIFLETQGWKEIKQFSLEESDGMQEAWTKERADKP